MELFKVQLVQK